LNRNDGNIGVEYKHEETTPETTRKKWKN